MDEHSTIKSELYNKGDFEMRACIAGAMLCKVTYLIINKHVLVWNSFILHVVDMFRFT